MTCIACEEDIVFCCYGELPAEVEDAVEHHLAGCAACRASEFRLVAMHRAIEAERWEPSLELLSACRQNLAASLGPTA
ncbi:MAG: zf-HC2 domain-containing protein [Acidobacteria bacterium]|jgi:anti-sigma factor RsiW|nr:zf-HC2 domain-containing protein [Acidobacteriota bacterium]